MKRYIYREFFKFDTGSNYVATLSSVEWIERAVEFDMGICIFYNRPVIILMCGQIDGSVKWSLKMHDWCLGKDGNFHLEPRPSSRSEKFIQDTRFDTPDEVNSFWVRSISEPKTLYMEYTEGHYEE